MHLFITKKFDDNNYGMNRLYSYMRLQHMIQVNEFWLGSDTGKIGQTFNIIDYYSKPELGTNPVASHQSPETLKRGMHSFPASHWNKNNRDSRGLV